ncbi:MAG: ABC transporter ATP-binding protein/permease [Coriobacteriales bacterium]|jgi:ATP-binding cassette subfamily B protein|nr:ABC transporter ATP-binding protein/permease [Coriobacteriales bacterium]
MKDQGAPKTGFARLLELAMTKKPLVIGSLVLSALAAVLSFVPYIAIYFIIREVLEALPDVSAANAGHIIGWGWMAFAGAVGNILVYFAALMLSHLAAFGTLYRLKVDFASHLARVPLGFHVLIGSGKLRKITDDNIEKIEGFIAHQLPDLAAAATAPVLLFVLLFAVDWRFGLAATAGVAIGLAIYAKMVGSQGVRSNMDRYQRALEDMNNATVEYVRGISVVKAFGQTVYSFSRLYDSIKNYTAWIVRYTLGMKNNYAAAVTVVQSVFLCIMPVAILIGMRVTPGGTAAFSAFATTVLFYLVLTQAVGGVMIKVIYASGTMMQITGNVAAMDAVLAQPELSVCTSPRLPDSYDVTFKDVSFSYDEKQDLEALSGVSFTAQQGQVTALVGPSGGGKSTIAHLVPRFFDASSGSVQIGGIDVREIDPHALMDMVGFVFQDVYLFKQSVMDNIRMGDPSASDERVFEAARDAQCAAFIEKLPQGYQTIIGTKGIHLSGGERQRLAIARAIVKNAPIVVLDEATAFSDPENEHLIQKAFERLMQGKTVIMIAHRLSTVRGADQIVVLDGGRVAQRGTHEELLEQSGRYGDMWRTYTQTSSWRMSATQPQARAGGGDGVACTGGLEPMRQEGGAL